MTENKGSDQPATESETQPSPQTPMIPSAPQQHEMGKNPECGTGSNIGDTTKQLEKDIRSGERWLIGINAGLILTNLLIAWIYYGQLRQMRTATEKAGISADAAKSAACTAAQALKDSEDAAAQTLCQMQAQTRAQQEAAGAAKSAADTADAAMRISERAYVVIGTPETQAVNDF